MSSKNRKAEYLYTKNDIVELVIDGMTSDGNGVGHLDGLAVFVPFAVIGDRLEVRIVKTAKNYLFGKIEKIINPSLSRIEPDCEVFGKCGGCVYRNVDYSAELEYKREKIVAAMKRIGGIDIDVPPVIGGERDRYRNKLLMPVGVDNNGVARCGFYSKRSHRIIECKDCLLHPSVFSQIVNFTFDYLMNHGVTAYNEITGNGLLRHIYLRHAPSGNGIMLCLVINGNKIGCEKEFVSAVTEKFKDIKSIVININKEKSNIILGEKCIKIYGDECIFGVLRGVNIRLSPLSFCQINSSQAEVLYSIAEEFAQLDENITLLDMYCGAGTIGLSMAGKVRKLIGVEIIEDAVKDANKNAEDSNISNSEFICADADDAADMIAKSGQKTEVVVLDPPRAGCTLELIDTIVSISPKRIVYVSCDVATQARDVAIFKEKGYILDRIKGVDMFPGTTHVESVCLLIKQNCNSKHTVNVGLDTEEYYSLKVNNG